MLNPFSFTLQNIYFLHNEFQGIHFSVGIFAWIISWMAVIVLICFLYAFGTVIRQRLVHISFSDWFINACISLAIGHIFFSTGIAILGYFSFLTPLGISIYLLLVLLITFIGLFQIPLTVFLPPKNSLNFFITMYQSNRIGSIFILLFIFLGLLRLLSPEIGVDAIYYHSDYPKEYLRIHSMMEYPLGTQEYLMTPQLGQMLNIVLLFFHLPLGLRLLHFAFYLCVIVLLLVIGTRQKITATSILPAFLFTASPVIIGVFGSGYMDMEWIFCWLLSFYLIASKPLQTKNIITSALLFGGVLAAKLQALPFFLTFILFIFLNTKKGRVKYSILFILISFIFPLYWYLRSFVVTGNPFFSDHPLPGLVSLLPQIISVSAIKVKLISLFINYHPFILLSFALLGINLILHKKIKTFPPLAFSLLLFINYSILPIVYFSGRFWLFGYSIFATLSTMIPLSVFKSRWYRIPLWTVTSILLAYYLFNSLITVPYGLGWADTNKYLTRVLARNNASYYDFDHLFSPHISKNDVIGTYLIHGFLYADFAYRDVAYVIRPHDSFDTIKKAGITKLIVKRGDMQWFCEQLELSGCIPDKYVLLASFAPAKQYLYQLR